jgi:hypothetical protein
MSLWRWLVICFCLGAVVGCDSFQATPCGESSRNLTLPYAYAAAYVVVTTDDHHPKISKNTEKSAGPDILAPVKTPSVITTQTAGDDAAGDATEVAAPPAAPIIVVFGFDGCEACEYLCRAYESAGIKYQYSKLTPQERRANANLAFPRGTIDGNPAEYQDFLNLLEKQK